MGELGTTFTKLCFLPREQQLRSVEQRLRGISWMSLILILSYRLKEVTNSNVLHCLEMQRFAHISKTRFRIVMGFRSKCRFLNGQVDYIENSKLNIADM